MPAVGPGEVRDRMEASPLARRVRLCGFRVVRLPIVDGGSVASARRGTVIAAGARSSAR